MAAGTPPNNQYALGYHAVFGDTPLTAVDFELYYAIQQRLTLASSEKGRETIRQEQLLRESIAMETGQAPPPVLPTAVFDPERMTADEIAAWLERYGTPI